MSEYKLVIPCLLGIEGLVATELREMGAENVEPENGRVVFQGSPEMIARANLWSRYGERVLVQLGDFRALSFEELFQGVKRIPWERWIGRKDAFPVKGRSLSSKLASVPDCQSIVKKAVVERLKQVYGQSWFEETGSLHQIQFLILIYRVTVLLDTSGAGLHKRGYRANSTLAPIKETLAAAMVYLSRVRRDANFVDPLCGSGTILIEAAMYAMNLAPGMQRRFAAERWEQIPSSVWRTERERARDLVDRSVEFHARGYDIDGEAVQLTAENARKAGVGSRIQVQQRNVADFRPEEPYGCVVCNPPYGERLLDIRQAEELYGTLGKVFQPKHGWNYTIISPDETFESCFGRKADRRKLYNGMLKCQVYMYYKNP